MSASEEAPSCGAVAPTCGAVAPTCGASSSANNGKKPLPKLSPVTNTDYWTQRWDDSNTPWKISEREAGDDGFYKNLRNLTKQPELSIDEIQPDAASGGPYHGTEVFVPLCGDSGALAFFFRRGFNVTGCDLSEVAVRAAMKESEDGVSVVEEKQEEDGNGAATAAAKNNKIPIKWTETEKDGVKIFTGQAKHNTATLVAGDFFKMPFGKYDLVYCRAAGSALPPAMKPAYFAKIREILTRPSDFASKPNKQRSALFSALPPSVSAAVWFGLHRRPAATRATGGPPFHCDLDVLQKEWYPAEEGFEIELVYVPSDEECEKTARGFVEGSSNIYLKG